MNDFNQILLDVHPEFTDLEAVDRAAALASKTKAAVKVVHVVEDYPEDMSEWWNVRNPLKLYNRIVGERQRYVDGIAQRVKAAGVDHVDSELRWGRDFLEITREVLRNHQELVVTTARRQGLLAGTRLGCVCVTGLCRYTPSTVWVTRNTLTKRATGIVAMLDGANGEFKCESLNAKILRTAANIAKAESSELHVVHALSLPHGKDHNGQRPESGLAKYLSDLRGQITEACNAVLGDIGIRLTEDRIHLPTGSATAAIPEFLEEKGLDLIVMGTQARDGIPGLLLGNTVEKVMTQVDCGVVVVKPDDFVSLVAREEGMGRRRTAA